MAISEKQAASVGGLLISNVRRNVAYWHLADIPAAAANVCFWINDGQGWM